MRNWPTRALTRQRFSTLMRALPLHRNKFGVRCWKCDLTPRRNKVGGRCRVCVKEYVAASRTETRLGVGGARVYGPLKGVTLRGTVAPKDPNFKLPQHAGVASHHLVAKFVSFPHPAHDIRGGHGRRKKTNRVADVRAPGASVPRPVVRF